MGGLVKFGTFGFGAYGVCFARCADLLRVGEASGGVGRVSGLRTKRPGSNPASVMLWSDVCLIFYVFSLAVLL